MCPLLLRPPVEFLPSVSALTGLPACRPVRSTSTSWRCAEVTGLWVFNAIARSSQPRGHVDCLTLFKGHHRAFSVGGAAVAPAERLPFAAAAQRIDALDLDVEQLLDRFLDLRLGRVHGDLEHDLVVFGGVGRLLGDERRYDDVVVARIVGGHLNRASSASSAARVSTSLFRRMMS